MLDYWSTCSGSYDSTKAFQDLSTSVDPETLGSVIGAGSQTIVISPYLECKANDLEIESCVMVITKEVEKYTYFESLFKDYEEKMLQKFVTEELWDEMQYLFDMLLSEGWNIFYMKKFEPYTVDTRSDLFKAMNEFTSNSWHNEFHVRADTLDFYLEELESSAMTLKETRLDEEFDEDEDEATVTIEFDSEEAKVFSALTESFTALGQSEIESNFKFDLHENQFVAYQDKLICIDPVLFNINNI